jgi:uncharacterized membrane protein YbhN (UPF0104 family)
VSGSPGRGDIAQRGAVPALRGAPAVEKGKARSRRRLVWRVLPGVVAVAAVASLVLAVDPRAVGSATRRFDPVVIGPLFAVAVAFYGLQGLRWHQLLRAVGIRQRVVDSELVNLAGQSVSAVLPLGDLTRAVLVSESSGAEFGAAAATVTVQELTFTLLLVLLAAPGLIHLPGGIALTGLVVLGVAAVVVILTVPRVFGAVDGAVRHVPGLRRLAGQVEALQVGVVSLLRQPSVLAWSGLDLLRVAVATTGMWLILAGLHTGSLSWWDAALVLAVSYVGGAVSLLPGGVGANEASVVGILAVLGVNPADAAAAAVLQRVSLSGVATVGGLGAYLAVRKRLDLGRRGGWRRLFSTRAPGEVEVELVGRQEAAGVPLATSPGR